MEKQKKVGMSSLNWILCILGIIFFSSLIILPPVFRAFVEEEGEVTPTPTPTPVSNSVVMTCTKNVDDVNTEYVIQGENDTVILFAETLTQYYPSITEEIETNCSNERALYQDIAGFHHSCRIEEDNMITESRVQVSEYIEGNIPITYNFKDSVSTLKSTLLADGFTCDTRNNK